MTWYLKSQCQLKGTVSSVCLLLVAKLDNFVNKVKLHMHAESIEPTAIARIRIPM
jgi:hypothetical protein